jgi:hypothetical protein
MLPEVCLGTLEGCAFGPFAKHLLAVIQFNTLIAPVTVLCLQDMHSGDAQAAKIIDLSKKVGESSSGIWK